MTDSEVSTAPPEAVILEYAGLVYKIAVRYMYALDRTGAVDMDDLLQAGRIALLRAQKHYDQDKEVSFLTYAFMWIKSEIRKTLGFDNQGKLPPLLSSLDTPISDEKPDGDTVLDTIEDPNAPDPEQHAELDSLKTDVRAAVDRLPDEECKAVIDGLFYRQLAMKPLAAEMGCTVGHVNDTRARAMRKLREDRQLRFYRPSFHVGFREFQATNTSEVEKTILWEEKQLEMRNGEGAYFS